MVAFAHCAWIEKSVQPLWVSCGVTTPVNMLLHKSHLTSAAICRSLWRKKEEKKKQEKHSLHEETEDLIPVPQWTIIAASWMKALHIVLNRENKEIQQNHVSGKRPLCFCAYLAKYLPPLQNIPTEAEGKTKSESEEENLEEESAALRSRSRLNACL